MYHLYIRRSLCPLSEVLKKLLRLLWDYAEGNGRYWEAIASIPEFVAYAANGSTDNEDAF